MSYKLGAIKKKDPVVRHNLGIRASISADFAIYLEEVNRSVVKDGGEELTPSEAIEQVLTMFLGDDKSFIALRKKDAARFDAKFRELSSEKKGTATIPAADVA